MGTGAFKFVEYVKGSHWRAVRFDQYFRKDRPYLDGYKAYFVRSNTVVSGLRGGQYDAEFRGRTPQERDQLVEAMKDKVTVQEGPWVTNILLTFNTERKPFDDVRVRRALTLAIDRWGGSEALGKVSLIKGVSGTFRPGAEWSLPKERAREDAGLLARHREVAGRGQAPAGGGRPSQPQGQARQPHHRPAVHPGRHLRRRPVAAHRRHGRARTARDQAVVCGDGRRRLRRGGAEHLGLRGRSRPRSSTRC